MLMIEINRHRVLVSGTNTTEDRSVLFGVGRNQRIPKAWHEGLDQRDQGFRTKGLINEIKTAECFDARNNEVESSYSRKLLTEARKAKVFAEEEVKCKESKFELFECSNCLQEQVVTCPSN